MRVLTQIQDGMGLQRGPTALCQAGGHINFTFTSVKESPQKCGTPFDISCKQAMWFVDEANSDVMHTSFNHRGYNVHLIHVNTW